MPSLAGALVNSTVYLQTDKHNADCKRPLVPGKSPHVLSACNYRAIMNSNIYLETRSVKGNCKLNAEYTRPLVPAKSPQVLMHLDVCK